MEESFPAKRSKIGAEMTLKEIVHSKQKEELWAEVLCTRKQLASMEKLVNDLCNKNEDESSSLVLLARQIEVYSEEISRLRKRDVKQEFDISSKLDTTDRTEINVTNEGALKELEVFKSLAEERLQTILKLQSQCDQLSSKLNILQQESSSVSYTKSSVERLKIDYETAISSLKEKDTEIRELKDILSKFRENQSDIINNAYSKIEEQRKSFAQNIENLEIENRRLRKERDNSRLMYEQVVTTSKASEIAESNTDSVREKLEAHFSKIRDLFASINLLLQQGKNFDFEEMISSLFTELETVVVTIAKYDENISELRKKVSEGETMMRNLQNDLLRSEFSLNQQKKEAELTINKAITVEKNALSISEKSERRERDVEARILENQTKVASLLLENKGLNDKISRLSREVELLKEKAVATSTDAEAKFSQNVHLLEVQNSELRKEIQRLHSAGLRGDTGELDMYKKLLKCNSCHVRDKNALILKCMHVFCRQCLDQRIESRQRKCPNCSESFGANDVRNIFL